jgi:uncharacterized membrane protein
MTDQRLEILVANLLRAGVLIAAAFVLTGGVGYLIHHGGEAAEYHEFQGAAQQYRDPAQIVSHALHPDWRAVIQLGLLVLIATPVTRVALALAGFALERDWMYVGITAAVLVILLYSLLG